MIRCSLKIFLLLVLIRFTVPALIADFENEPEIQSVHSQNSASSDQFFSFSKSSDYFYSFSKSENTNVVSDSHVNRNRQATPTNYHNKKKSILRRKAKKKFKEMRKNLKIKNIKNYEEIYTKTKDLGNGGFSEVFLVTSKKENKEYALKKTTQKSYFLNEVAIMRSLNSPYIIKMYDFFKSCSRYNIFKNCFFPRKCDYFQVLEYAPNGDLGGYLREARILTEEEAWPYFFQIIQMVKYLHEHELQIAYLDLKPANILINADGMLKLADFGLSKPSACISGRCGTAKYMAPEARQSKNSDLYSLGVILFEMVFGDEALELAKLKNTPVSSEILQYLDTQQYGTNGVEGTYSAEVKDIIIGLIEKNPSERIGSEEKGGIRSIENNAWYKLMYKKVNMMVRANDGTTPAP